MSVTTTCHPLEHTSRLTHTYHINSSSLLKVYFQFRNETFMVLLYSDSLTTVCLCLSSWSSSSVICQTSSTVCSTWSPQHMRFTVTRPTAWNSLPDDLWDDLAADSRHFMQNLTTHSCTRHCGPIRAAHCYHALQIDIYSLTHYLCIRQ